MKRNNLPKGVIITGALLSTMLLATGCSTTQEVIDDYNPSQQIEMDVYGPAPYVETPESEDNGEVETTETDIEIPDNINEATLDYGVIEGGYKDNIDEYDPYDSKDISVYGPPEAYEPSEPICVYGPPEDMIDNN